MASNKSHLQRSKITRYFYKQIILHIFVNLYTEKYLFSFLFFIFILFKNRIKYLKRNYNYIRFISYILLFVDLHCVILKSRISQFWRHQKKSPRWYLATIEAIHQFLVELHTCAFGIIQGYANIKDTEENSINNTMLRHTNGLDERYKGQYDDLLYFFKYMYEKIHIMYDHEKLWAYKRPLI